MTQYFPRESRFVLLVIAAAALLSGCSLAERSLKIPDAAHVEIHCYFENGDLSPKQFDVEDERKRLDLIDSLRGLRWTEPGVPLAEIGLRRPDIDILLTDEFDNQHGYQLYWENHSLLDQGAGLLLIVQDITPVRAQITAITGLTTHPTEEIR